MSKGINLKKNPRKNVCVYLMLKRLRRKWEQDALVEKQRQDESIAPELIAIAFVLIGTYFLVKFVDDKFIHVKHDGIIIELLLKPRTK